METGVDLVTLDRCRRDAPMAPPFLTLVHLDGRQSGRVHSQRGSENLKLTTKKKKKMTIKREWQ